MGATACAESNYLICYLDSTQKSRFCRVVLEKNRKLSKKKTVSPTNHFEGCRQKGKQKRQG